METFFYWKNIEWLVTPKWGETHPNESLYWWGEKAVNFNNNGEVVLDILYNPKLFDNIMKPYNTGFIRSTLEYGYGIYEWDVTMPQGKHLYPALWMAADEEWPPEIDCMEGYSNSNSSYIKNLLFVNVKPNVHWLDNNLIHKDNLKNNILFCTLRPKKKNHYKVILKPDEVSIWYNSFCVAKYNDKEMLQHFNKENIKWHININTGIQRNFTIEDYYDYKKKGKPMIVHNFSFTPL